MKKRQNIFTQGQEFEEKIAHLEERIMLLDQKIDQLNQLQRNHLLRIKNHEPISDEFIYYGRKYNDLPPNKAWKMYNDENVDYILIDVSDEDFNPIKRLPEAHHIPWKTFKQNFYEVVSHHIPMLFISEDGTNSILACEFLSRKGFYNCNNVSGGYKHWVGFKLSDIKSA